MTAPLFDLKAKFSEYVTPAENGESFSEHYRKWLKDCGDERDDSYAQYLEECRKISGSNVKYNFPLE